MKSEHPCSRPVIWSRRSSWCKSASCDRRVPFQTKQHEWSLRDYKHPSPLRQIMRKMLDDFRGCLSNDTRNRPLDTEFPTSVTEQADSRS